MPDPVFARGGEEHGGTDGPSMEHDTAHHTRADRKGKAQKETRTFCADTKYDMPLNRFYPDGKGIGSQIPDNPTRKRRPGRPRAFDEPTHHRIRSSIERFNAWIKAFRRVATRYDRLPQVARAQVYMGFVHLACMVIYLRNLLDPRRSR